MANSYKLEVVTPEQVLISEDVVETNAPGTEGYLGILAFHMPLLTGLAPGEVRVQLADGRTTRRIVISGGFLEVSPTKTTILADAAAAVEEIDVDAATADLSKARASLAQAEPGSPEHSSLLSTIGYAEARISASRG